MHVKFYVEKWDHTIITFRSVHRIARFHLGKLAYFNSRDGLYGRVSGVGMEGKCLAVHLQKEYLGHGRSGRLPEIRGEK